MAQTWRLDHSIVLDNDGNPVAIIADPAGDGGGERIEWPWVYDEAPPASYAQAEDNARLIAAAPELLAALTRTHHALSDIINASDNCECGARDTGDYCKCPLGSGPYKPAELLGVFIDDCNAAHAAIDKAKGQKETA